MSRVSDPSFQFWYDEKWYTVQGASTMARTGTKDDLSTMRAEYTRMRDVAQKRLNRLAKAFPESKASKHFYDTGKRDKEGNPIMARGFQKLKNLDPRDFAKAFADLAKFVKAKGSTVTGQKQIKAKTIKTWQEQGIDLNQQNYDMTIKILEEVRKQKIVYGSDKVKELADTMLGLDKVQQREWLNHLDVLLKHTDELKEIPEVSGYTFDEVLDMIGE